MLKDLPKGLIDAVAAINQKSQKAFAEEQKALAAKKPGMPGIPKPKADKPAVDSAAAQASKNVKEEATTPTTPSEKKLAALSGDKKKITFGDVLKGRGVRKESWDDMMKAVRERQKPQPNGGSGKKEGTRYGGGKQKDVKEGVMDALKKAGKKVVDTLGHGSDEDMIKDLQKKAGVPQTGKKPVKENMDTPGNSTHQCAIHVKSEQFGEGKTLFSQHAEPDADGNIAWYDVMFAEGIKRVETKDIEVLVSESHMDHKKKKKA